MAIGTTLRRLAAVSAITAAAACGTPGPRPLAFGQESCGHCHMTLADPRFAAELVTRTGKTIPFDDIGCLATFIATGGIPRDAVHSLWVHDVTRPDSLLPLTSLVLLHQDSIATPMDHGVVAVRPGRADSLRAQVNGRILTWDDVLALVAPSPPR